MAKTVFGKAPDNTRRLVLLSFGQGLVLRAVDETIEPPANLLVDAFHFPLRIYLVHKTVLLEPPFSGSSTGNT